MSPANGFHWRGSKNVSRMTKSKRREFQRRIDELARIFHVKPPPTREEAICTLAMHLAPEDDLFIVDRVLTGGREPANEREYQACAAYFAAFDKATELIDRGSRRKSKIGRRNSAPDGTTIA